jgi:AAA ATPase domain
MPGPGELPSPQRARIIGRDAGLARLRVLVDPDRPASRVLLVTGEAGMGKSVLLADAAERARSAGLRVLSVTGRESESKLAFAGLHQLLRPVLPAAAGLPGRQAQALLGALGLSADPGPADPLLTGVAVLTLLSDLSGRSPVLVLADDAHWLDRSSLDALAFAASRLDAERVVLLVGARGQAPPSGFDRGVPELHLEPLSAGDAGLLLDGQPRPPRGQARAQVLAQAAGNPMALIELATVIADDPAASRRWAAEPLPLTDRLSAVLTSRFAALPEPTQAALLLAAVADGFSPARAGHRPGPRHPGRPGPGRSLFRQRARRSRRGSVAVRAGPASPRLRRMAAAAPPDQRRQARPDAGPGHLPPTRCPVMGAAHRGRAQSVRGGGRRRARRTRCPRGAHPPSSARSSAWPAMA